MSSTWYTAHRAMLNKLIGIETGVINDTVELGKNAFSNWIPPATEVFALFTGSGGDHSHISTSRSGHAGAMQTAARIIGRFSFKNEQMAMDFANVIMENMTLLTDTDNHVDRLILQTHPDINPSRIRLPNKETDTWIWEITIDFLMLYTITSK